MNMKKEYIAYNLITNAFFVKGKGFIGNCAGASSPLNSCEAALIRASYQNVVISKERL
jgi:hypothetical protein